MEYHITQQANHTQGYEALKDHRQQAHSNEEERQPVNRATTTDIINISIYIIDIYMCHIRQGVPKSI